MTLKTITLLTVLILLLYFPTMRKLTEPYPMKTILKLGWLVIVGGYYVVIHFVVELFTRINKIMKCTNL